MHKPLRIILLGATGSIGDSTLKLVRAHPEQFQIVGMSAHSNAEKLATLAHEFKPSHVALHHLNGSNAEWPKNCQLITGENASEKLLDQDADIVVAAMLGASGVKPVMKALTLGRTVALANKEALACAGRFMMEASAKHNAKLLPIDSEHNAIYQLLDGQPDKHLTHITLTASGGPFLHSPLDSLKQMTPAQAIAHPKWSMGSKISVDSATMMNKGLECIEAHWLFNIAGDKIRALIHPQAIMHGMVTFQDGSSLAHLSCTDMTIPISYCLFGKERAPSSPHMLDIMQLNGLEFMEIDRQRYPAFFVAMQALNEGMAACIALNASNEIAVQAFMEQELSFTDISVFVDKITEQHAGLPLESIEDVLALDAEVRIKAREILTKARKHYA